MINVYETSTSLEAHMIVNLLQQYDIASEVEGDLLQGGIGDLQAMNLVRVMVAEADVETARKIIGEWEAKQVDTPSVIENKSSALNMLIVFISGVILGIAISYLTFIPH